MIEPSLSYSKAGDTTRGWLLVYRNGCDLCAVVDGSEAFLDDLKDAIGFPCQPSDFGIGVPPGPGLWRWEGAAVTLYDWDVDYRGKYGETPLWRPL